MKPLFSICSTLLLLFTTALTAQTDYSDIDQRMDTLEYSGESIADFAARLTVPYASEEEKARAIYAWITKTVRYDCRKYFNRKTHSINYSSPEEFEEKMKAFRTKQALKTLKAKRGICDDYSNLFAHLGRAAGLEVEVVTGLTKAGIGKRLKGIGHAWNAVKLDGTWHLLDPTWGSGYVKGNCRAFVRKFKDAYFLIPARQLQYTHFPDDQSWTLLEQPLSKKDFINAPEIGYGFHELGVQDFTPSTGKTTLTKGKLQVSLQARHLQKVTAVYVTENDYVRPVDYEIVGDQMEIKYQKKRGSKMLTFWVEIEGKKEDLLTYKI